MAATPESAAALSSQLSGVEAHLAQRQIPVDSVSVATPTGQGTGSPGDSTGQQAGQNHQSHPQSHDPASTSGPALPGRPLQTSPAADTPKLQSTADPTSISGMGRHISVRV
jgi:hypothetical protein